MESRIIHGDSAEVLKSFSDDSFDTLICDPPYGYGFMGKHWDKALPDIGIFKETLRVLKPGAFAFVMSAPRSDVCSRMSLLLEDAGFNIAFTPIYWTYASGFPKAMNIGKMVDKRKGSTSEQVQEFADFIKKRRAELCYTLRFADNFVCGGTTNYSWFEGRSGKANLPSLAEYANIKILLKLDDRFDHLIGEAAREVTGHKRAAIGLPGASVPEEQKKVAVTAPATDAAKALDGSYGGFQPKPAVEVVIVAMKPLSEKTYVDQALKNGKGITWLGDCRIPYAAVEPDKDGRTKNTFQNSGTAIFENGQEKELERFAEGGRFPANLLVSDDVLNGHSRFFSLDEWAQTLPFLAVPKASKSEKNAGTEHMEARLAAGLPLPAEGGEKSGVGGDGSSTDRVVSMTNHHPTVKPLKLMSYLVTLGSRPGDLVLDPFCGSGTTCIAAKELNRNFVGIERETEYVEIARARLATVQPTLLTNQQT